MVFNQNFNKEFWLKVKEEFIDSNHSYLCHGSPLFKYHWLEDEDFYEYLFEIAEDFLIETRYNSDAEFFLGKYILFDSDSWTNERYRTIRLDFLDWCINNFE